MFCLRPPLEPGNFSFIKNKTLRFALEYDYIHVLPVIEDLSPRGDTHFNDGKRSSFDSDRPNDLVKNGKRFSVLHSAVTLKTVIT